MGIKFANQAFGTLASAITSGQTSITLTTGQGARFPAVTAGSGDYFLLTLANAGAYEVVMCVARAGDVLTVFRGLEGTTAAAFNAGDVCENRMTAGTMGDLSGANYSFRNVVRNALNRIAQRGTSIAMASGTQAYTLDGWLGGNIMAPAACTFSQQADVGSFSLAKYSLRATVTTAQAAPAAGDYAYLLQPIEGFLVYDMIGRPVAIRLGVRSAKTGLHSVALRNANGSASYIMTYTVTVANTWQVVTLALPTGLNTAIGTAWNFDNGVGLYLSFCFGIGTTYATATTNQWVAGNFLGATGQVNAMDTVGNIFAISDVQMEQNLVSSRLEIPTIEADLLRQQRYYEVARCVVATTLNGTAPLGMLYWKATKRATPTLIVTVDSGSGAGFTPFGAGGTSLPASGMDGAYQNVANSVQATAAVTGNAEL